MATLGKQAVAGLTASALVGGVLFGCAIERIGPALSTERAEADGSSLLVRFASGTEGERAVLLDHVGAVVSDTAGATGYAVLDTGGRPAGEVAGELAGSDLVAAVEPNGVRRAASLPNDTFWDRQSAYLSAIGLPIAWDTTTGSSGLVLAILDSGVDFGHPDLAGRLLPGYDIVNDDGDPTDDDDGHHGTMVAGIAAANTNNAVGVAGATWVGKILPVKVLDAEGTASDADIASGITWAVDHGADVINLSLGGPGASDALQVAVDYAVAHDVVVVAAAGNDGNTVPHYPAAADGVIAVGATDAAGRTRAGFSNHGAWVDMMAPGTDITSTGVRAPGLTGYSTGSGTSFAAPLVAGAAMLARAADPGAGATVIAQRLTSSATDIGLLGLDLDFGHGLLSVVGVLLGSGATTAPAGSTDRVVATEFDSDDGYWMLDSAGTVFDLGAAVHHGQPSTPGVDIEPAPDGAGYWVVGRAGDVHAFGSATSKGGLAAGDLAAGEAVTSLSATPSGRGYWIVTTAGNAFNFGDAAAFGDLGGVRLNGPILDSVATPSGRGYYMVGSDGGIFAFGDADFSGSMGGRRLNAPVESLVPDPDGHGYWLVATDGGVFAFDARFRGSMGGIPLAAPVTGMVSYGNGYLMVGRDGGVFNFSDQDFVGSLGGVTVGSPVVALAALPA